MVISLITLAMLAVTISRMPDAASSVDTPSGSASRSIAADAERAIQGPAVGQHAFAEHPEYERRVGHRRLAHRRRRSTRGREPPRRYGGLREADRRCP